MVSLSTSPLEPALEESAKVKFIRSLLNVMANEIDLHHRRFEFTSGFRTRATTEQKKVIGNSKSIHSTTLLTVANLVFDFNPPPAEPQDVLFKTRAMRKRKATDSGLRGVELIGALHTLSKTCGGLSAIQRERQTPAREREGMNTRGRMAVRPGDRQVAAGGYRDR